MLKRILGIALSLVLCLPTTAALAATDANASNEDINISATTEEAIQMESDNLLDSQEIIDGDIKINNSIGSDVNEELLEGLQNSAKAKLEADEYSIATCAVDAADTTNDKPIADLQYLILNPDSLKDGQITTETQIAWLWSYNGQNFTYDPNGYAITSVNLDGIPSLSDSVLGTLTDDSNVECGFATQFSTAGQYVMTFKCMNENNVWSDEWSISIPVEPADDNTRPQCRMSYSPRGTTDSNFTFDWSRSYDNDADDSITSAEAIVLTDTGRYSLADYVTSYGTSSLTAKFPSAGVFTVLFRVCDSHGAWSNWTSMDVTVLSDSPAGLSATDAWAKIKANSANSTSQEAFNRSLAKSSKYIGSTTDASGEVHDFYLLTLEDKYKATSTNYLTQFDTCLIYDNNYLTSKQYHNGYYGTWFPVGSLSFADGVMSADLGFKKYSYVDFNDYNRLHIFDFYSAKDYTVEYFDFQHDKPYTVFNNLVNHDQIIYGQAGWYSDGSGSSFLSRINRKTGVVLTNKNIVFGSNSDIFNGNMLNSTDFQFVSSKDGYTYTINVNTLQVISKTQA